MLKELYIESNIPIIFLTIIIICIIIYGYLEIKKINNRFDSLNSKIESLIKQNNDDNKQNNYDNNKDIDENNAVIMEDIMVNKEEGFEEDEQVDQDYEEEAEVLLNNYNEKNNQEYIEEEWSENNQGKIIDLNVSPEENYKELIIQKINSGEHDFIEEAEIDIESAESVSVEEVSVDVEEVSVEEVSVDLSDNKEIDYEGVSILNMKDEKEGEEEEEIVVDERLSVNQLREICRELDLPQSGNKSKLIKRINENK